jgi:hypothetical protein
MPANHPCGSNVGIDGTNVRQLVYLRNNILVTQVQQWWKATRSQLGFYTSDHSMGHQWESRGAELELDGGDLSLEQWRTATGLDRNTIRAAPQFVDAPVYASSMPGVGNETNQWGFRVPTSAAQARAWFALRTGSPGRNAGSDGLDIGIDARAAPAFGPRPPTNVRIIR